VNRRIPSLVLLALVGCDVDNDRERSFDGPLALAPLLVEDGSPFDGPVAFVANTRSGTIVPLDLKHATLLGDQYGSPWLRSRWVATGDLRQLGELAVYLPEPDQVSVVATDLGFDVVIEAPYTVGMDPDPQFFETQASEPLFLDEDASGDAATLSDLTVRSAFTTTEDWTIEYDGDRWWVYGSRSGKQGTQASFDQAYITDQGELSFTIEGSATVGDRFELRTDNGLVEHDVGGSPLALQRVPDSDLVVVSVWDAAAERGFLALLDLRQDLVVHEIDLPAGAQPWRMDLGATPDDLFVADSRASSVHRVRLDADDPTASALVESLETAGPVQDLAWVGQDADPLLGRTAFSHLAVAPAWLNRVDLYDLDGAAWLDTNPDDEVEGGLDLRRPVVGLSSSREAVRLQETTAWDAQVERPVVAVTTFDGTLRLVEGQTGCLSIDEGGPGVTSSSGIETIDFSDQGNTSNPALLADDATGRSFTTPDCGGILQSEGWTLTYDGVTASWEVEGTLSGLQANRAYEDERYLSDDGALSFLILAGTQPSTDGDRFSFTSASGVLELDEVANAAGGTDPLELPGPPLVVWYRSGPTGGGWDLEQRRAYALVAITNSDWVLRVRLDTWASEAIWD
jgi:hypothetical protein